ncbi:MAG: hypothetical protein ACREMY_06620, partial [bacterium]
MSTHTLRIPSLTPRTWNNQPVFYIPDKIRASSVYRAQLEGRLAEREEAPRLDGHRLDGTLPIDRKNHFLLTLRKSGSRYT